MKRTYSKDSMEDTMNIKVDRKELINVLSNMSNIIRETPVRPVLGGTKLTADENGIEFVGTTLEMSLKNKIDGIVTEKGAVVFKIGIVLEYIKLIEVDEIEISVKENKLYIHNAEFSIFDAEEYPRLNNVNGEKEFTMDIMDLLDGFEKVKFSASTQSDNLALNCVRMESYDNKLHFVTSDNFRLSYYTYEVNVPSEFEISVPLDAVNALIKIFKSYDGALTISIEGSQLKIESDNVVFTTRLIDMPFPDYRAIFKNLEGNKKIEANKDILVSALKKVYTVAKINQETKDAAIFKFQGNKLNITAASGRAKTTQNIDTIKEGEDLKASLNVKYILDFVGNLQNNILINCTNGSSMFVFREYKNDSYIYMLMPLALREE
jgi:DNA polymerase-3 subunit beta